MLISHIAAIGDVADVGCWSGIPFHFWQATCRGGWEAKPIGIRLGQAGWRRRRWNARQWILGRGTGGYQYSEEFSDWAWQFVGEVGAAPRVLSFHPFTPSLSRLQHAGGEFSLYFDATHPLMMARYGLGKSVSGRMARFILDAERRVYDAAARLVFFQRWAADSAVRDCGADPAKVSVILPGANLDLPPTFQFNAARAEPDPARPFRLGYVGKDWRRKGFPKLLATVEILNRMGLRTVLRCIGRIPTEAERHPQVEYFGYLDKRTALPTIIDIMASCDFGCLLSEVEASSIAILEFLRVGVPVVATVVDGMADLVPPDAGLRIDGAESPAAIAERMAGLLRNPEDLSALRSRARRWSNRVTWDRCVAEWSELLRTGRVARPVQPWRGLDHAWADPAGVIGGGL